MAAENIELSGITWATIESADVPNRVKVQGVPGNIVNIGEKSVFVSTNGKNLARDGLQREGEVELQPGDTMPVPPEAKTFHHQTLDTEVGKLWYVPRSS